MVGWNGSVTGALVVNAVVVGGWVGVKSLARSKSDGAWRAGCGSVGAEGVTRGPGTGGGEPPTAGILGSGLGSRGAASTVCLPPLTELRDLDFKKLMKPLRLVTGGKVVVTDAGLGVNSSWGSLKLCSLCSVVG